MLQNVIRRIFKLIGILIGILITGFIVLFFVIPFFQKPQLLNIPDLAKWTGFSDGKYTISYNEESGFLVEGDDSQFLYQLQSSPIPVSIFPKTYIFNLPIIVHQGNVAVGVLNSSLRNWIIPANELRDEYVFKNKFNSSVTIIIANYNLQPTGNLPSRFTILKPE